MVKVLIAGGGGHRTETEMIKGLSSAGVDVHAAFYPGSFGLRALKNTSVPTRALPLRSNLDLSGIKMIREWIKGEGFDIVHGLANRQVANFIWASYGLANALVAYRGAVGHVSRWDPSCYLKWLNPRLNKIICVSRAVEADLKANGVPSKKLVTIYKGHDPSWYAGFSRFEGRARLTSEFRIPHDDRTIIIGMAANMRRVKGADLLMQAMTDLPDHIHAVLIGEVRDQRIQMLAQKESIRKRVHFAGYRTDASELLSGIDIVVAPSRGREGLTKGVIEAMAQGIPAVVSTAGGLPELVEDGVTGHVISIDDVLALRSAIQKLAADPEQRAAMGVTSKQRIVDCFPIKKTVEQTALLYTELRNG